MGMGAGFGGGASASELGFEGGELVDAAGVTPAFELGGQEQINDLLAIDSDYNFRRYEERYPYHDHRHWERMKTALTAAGLK